MNAESSVPHFQLTFKEVVIILSDGNEMLMSKCIGCNFVTRYNTFSKQSHWRNCPSRWSFKYTSQSENAGFTSVCLKCHISFNSSVILDRTLEKHSKECLAANSQSNDNLANDFVTYEAPNGIEYIYEHQISRRELHGQLKINNNQNAVISAPGYRIKFTLSTRGLERYGECQKCKKRFTKPNLTKFSIHRRTCSLQAELLISVSTQPTQSQPMQLQPMLVQPFDMTISSSILDDELNLESLVSAVRPRKTCFICNTRTSENFVNLHETVSKHSLTSIYDFVWKFLDDQPSVRDDSIEAANASYVCAVCLDKINAYDLACQSAAQFEQELRECLAHTESLYAQQQGAQQVSPQYRPTDDESEQIEVVRDLVADPLEVNPNDDDVDFPEIIEIDATGQEQTEEAEENNDDAQCILVSDEETEQSSDADEQTSNDEANNEQELTIEVSDDESH